MLNYWKQRSFDKKWIKMSRFEYFEKQIEGNKIERYETLLVDFM